MRLSRIPLLMMALPFWLTACGAPATPAPGSSAAAAADPAAAVPAPADAPAGTPPPPTDRTEALTPHTRDAALDPAATQPEAPVAPVETAHEDGARQRIAALLGDADQYERVFNAFKAAVIAGDRPQVVEHVRFPLRVAGGKQISGPGEFQRSYESIITPAVVKALKAQDFDSVFVNAQGVMLGDGQVWINGQCLDQACARTEVKVVTIQ